MNAPLTVPATTPDAAGRRLSAGELAATVHRHARELREGRYVAEFDSEQRWHARVHQDADVDVWLIGWTTEQGTELHDHGTSSGAFTVVEGTLDEAVWSGPGPDDAGELEAHRRVGGETVTFGPGHVHDVRNRDAAPAVSVHAYSPPLREMHFYEPADGRLTRWGSSWADDPEAPAPPRLVFTSVDQMLDRARETLTRLTPAQAHTATADGAQLVDIRPEWQRRADGEIPGAVVIERNHLEWRLRPASEARLPWVEPGTRWIVFCTEGYTSSLAAASLVSLGLDATDVVGGIHAWREAGLPVARSVTAVEQLVA